VITKDLLSTVYLTSCYALSSDHLPVPIDTACRSSFKHPPHPPDFRRTEWASFQTHLEDQIPFNPELHNEIVIGLPNRALKHFPQRTVSLLVQILNAILLTHHFPSMWKHAR
jgi:hypothetical protein